MSPKFPGNKSWSGIQIEFFRLQITEHFSWLGYVNSTQTFLSIGELRSFIVYIEVISTRNNDMRHTFFFSEFNFAEKEWTWSMGLGSLSPKVFFLFISLFDIVSYMRYRLCS